MSTRRTTILASLGAILTSTGCLDRVTPGPTFRRQYTFSRSEPLLSRSRSAGEVTSYLLVDDEQSVNSIRWDLFEYNTADPYRRVDVPREFLVVTGIEVTEPFKIDVTDHSMTGGTLEIVYERRHSGGSPYDTPRYSYNMTKWASGWSSPSNVSVEVVDEELG